MNRQRVAYRLGWAIALGIAARTAVAQEQTTPAYRHRVLGVYDLATGLPLEGAAVTDIKSGTSALTTKTGTVSLVFLPDGGGLVRVRKVGYAPTTRFVSITPDDTVPVTLLLTPSTVALPAMVTRDSMHYISPGLRDFEERRRTGPGYFITEAELRKADNRNMQDVLRSVPGLQISCVKTFPNACYAVSSRSQSKYAILGGGACTYSIYIDGINTLETDVNKFNVRDFAGVESYTGAAKVPQRYNTTGNACGVLLFWSRER